MENCKVIFAPIIIFLVIIGITGCVVYVPPIGAQFTEKKQASVIAGKTTQDEVIKLLGKPDILEDDHFFVYDKGRSFGTILFFAVGYLGGDIIPLPVNAKNFLILLQFDDQKVVKRYEIESAEVEAFVGSVPAEGGTSPHEGKLLFNAESRDLLGGKTRVGFNAAAFSPDGRLLGTSGFKLVGGAYSSKRIWIKNLETDEIRVIDTPSYDNVVFASDITRAAILHRTVTILDTKTGKTLLVYKGHGDSVIWTLKGASCLAFDRQNRLIATGGYQGNIRIWDSRTGEDIFSYKGHEDMVLSVAWFTNGYWLATSGVDGFTRLWNSKTGEKLAELEKTAGILRFSPDSKFLAINRGSHAELWKVKTLPDGDAQHTEMQLYDVFLLPDSGMITPLTLDFSPDGKLLAASNGSVVVYDIDKRRKVGRLIPTGVFVRYDTSVNDAAYALLFSPDGKSLVMGTKEGVYSHSIQKLEQDFGKLQPVKKRKRKLQETDFQRTHGH